MKIVLRISALALFFAGATSLLALQRSAQFPGYGGAYSYSDEDNNVKAEFSWSRLRYDNFGGFGGGFYGYGRGSWSQDYPKADRQLTERPHDT